MIPMIIIIFSIIIVIYIINVIITIINIIIIQSKNIYYHFLNE